MEEDIRWKQRFMNYEKALHQLIDAIKTNGENPVDIIKEGIIQRFEFTHELGWKVLKDYLEYEGYQNINGSRSATREAFNKGIIQNGQSWMDMIEGRNQTVHTYNHSILEIEFNKILKIYSPLFLELDVKMKTLL